MRPASRAAAAVAATATVLLAVTGCGSGGGDHASSPKPPPPPDLTSAPANLRWETYQGVALPFGKDGPAKINNGAATGYSRTPQGAALAAIQHSIRYALAPDESWATVAAQSLVPGPGKDAWVLARERVGYKGTDKAATPRIVGYKITAWTQDRSDVTVYATYPDASTSATDTVVTWSGDWRLLLPDPATKTTANVHDVPALASDAVALEAKR